jgi:hypothetical protein
MQPPDRNSYSDVGADRRCLLFPLRLEKLTGQGPIAIGIAILQSRGLDHALFSPAPSALLPALCSLLSAL